MNISKIIDHLPTGVRDRPAWMFLGLIYSLTGLGYATGYTYSIVSVTVGSTLFRIWGVLDIVVGILVALSTALGRPAFEKFALRCLSVLALTYAGWLAIALDFDMHRGASTIVFGVFLAIAAQLRVRSLTIYMMSARKLAHDLQRINDHD